MTFSLEPIGFFHCAETYPYDVPRQPSLAGENPGYIELAEGRNFELALTELETFDRLWILFVFHRNETWHPMICPPRHREKKVGVFASRSPYRPNPIGLSCVRLAGIQGRIIQVTGHDLLEGTPVLDIKPYLPYADAFPDASPGWTAENCRSYSVEFSPLASAQLSWLEEHQVPCIRSFLRDRLEAEPLNPRRSRLLDCRANGATLAYRTWRAEFLVCEEESRVQVLRIASGYSPDDLANPLDKYGDKATHRLFLSVFSNSLGELRAIEKNP